MMFSDQFYNLISAKYQKIAKERSAYISTVNQVIIDHCSQGNVASWLDVGTGDGLRILSILSRTNSISRISVVEPSLKMLNVCKEHLRHLSHHVDYFNCSIEAFPATEEHDLITCLWNVIGHSSDPFIFLKSIRENMTINSLAIFDCNNSFNIRQYKLDAIRNMLKALLRPKELLSFKLSKCGYSTNVRILNPFQITSLLKRAGFSEWKLFYIDYTTGRPTSSCCGQMLVLAW